MGCTERELCLYIIYMCVCVKRKRAGGEMKPVSQAVCLSVGEGAAAAVAALL